MNVLSASISVEIICFKHLQQGSYELKGGIFLQECIQPNASQVAIMVALGRLLLCSALQVEISHSHIRHIFCSPKPSKI